MCQPLRDSDPLYTVSGSTYRAAIMAPAIISTRQVLTCKLSYLLQRERGGGRGGGREGGRGEGGGREGGREEGGELYSLSKERERATLTLEEEFGQLLLE